jgi:hypothetical protein
MNPPIQVDPHVLVSVELMLVPVGCYNRAIREPVGSPTRDAIAEAYRYGQEKMLIAATAFMILSFVWVGMMRNLNVKKMTQTKGNTLRGTNVTRGLVARCYIC